MKKHNREQKSSKGKLFVARQMLFLLTFFMMSILAHAQNKSFTGVIKDASGEPIIGATVLVKGSQTGTLTDVDGRYKIEATPGSKLQISYVGYVKQDVTAGDNTTIDITLKEASTELDAVVVVGYGTQKKTTLTGAVVAVTSKEMTATKNENVMNMLTGKLPGVRVTQMSSRPGAFETDIDIRGMEGSPLIVIDGVPRDKDYLGRMDANEIESISVLKDASAAVYGLRSSNGVILVTTKRGDFKNGGFNISYSFNQGWQQFLYVPDNVDAVQYMKLRNEKQWRDFNNNYMSRQTPVFVQGDMDPYLNGTKQTTNWMDAAFKKTAPQSQHNVTMDGGTEKVAYFFNLGYMKQEGALRTGDMNYDRWNFRSNVDLKITNNLKAMVSVGGYIDEMNEPRTDIWAVYKNAWIERPDAEIYANGNPEYLNGVNLIGDHPLAVTNSDITGYRKRLNKVFNGQMALVYDLPWVKGLSAKASYSYDFKSVDNTDYKKFYSLYEYDGADDMYKVKLSKNAPASSIQRESFPDYKTLMQLSANYTNTFGKHNVSGLVLFEEEYSSWDSFYAYSELKLNSQYLSAASGSQLASMYGIGERTGQGLVGKFNYDYSGKYLAEFSFRYDGSSKFPKGSRWGFFPAASVGWRLSEESFIKDNSSLNFIDNFKIRASYGKTADDGAANNYPPSLGFNIDKNKSWMYGEELQPGLVPMPLLNPNFSWYTSKTLDIGVDWTAWNGLFGGSFDYFQRDRKDLPATRLDLIPGTVGASLPQENLESDRTSGLELVLTHRHKVGEVSYYANLQLSTTREEWRTKIESQAGNSYDNWKNRSSNRYKDIWWGKKYGGQFQNYDQIYNHPVNVGAGGTVPGDYYYGDWNGDGVIDDKDEYPIATYGKPRFNYGISLGADWRGIDVSMHFQGAADVYVQYGEMLAEPLAFGGGGTMNKFWDRWHPEDANADIFDPSTKWVSGYYPTTGSPIAEGTRAVQSASYLRLKTLEIGYTIPKKLISKVGVKDLRVYVSGYNLLTFTKLKDMDPERPGGAGQNESDRSKGGWTIDNYKYPINKTFNVGLSLKF